MNRAEQIIARGGAWVDASSLFDDPPSPYQPPVLVDDLPRVCQSCGTEYAAGKGRSKTRCPRCVLREGKTARPGKGGWATYKGEGA
jgi:hypothetical protein